MAFSRILVAAVMVAAVACATSQQPPSFCDTTTDPNWKSRCDRCHGDPYCSEACIGSVVALGNNALNAADRCKPNNNAVNICIFIVSYTLAARGTQNPTTFIDRCFQNNCAADPSCPGCVASAIAAGNNEADRCVEAVGHPKWQACVGYFLNVAGFSGSQLPDFGNRLGFMDYCRACGDNKAACSICVPASYRLQNYQDAQRCTTLTDTMCGAACQSCLTGIYFNLPGKYPKSFDDCLAMGGDPTPSGPQP